MKITETLTQILALADEIQEAHHEMTKAYGEFSKAYKEANQKLNLAYSKLTSLAAIARDMASKS